MALNEHLSLADWDKLSRVNKGEGNGGLIDPKRASVHVVHLPPGKIIYRFTHNDDGTKWHQAAGEWWSTQTMMLKILQAAEDRAHRGGRIDVAYSARLYSAIKVDWSALQSVVCARVKQPIKALLGVGEKVSQYDRFDHHRYDQKKLTPAQLAAGVGYRDHSTYCSRGLQLYVPGLDKKINDTGPRVLSSDARQHLEVLWSRPSSTMSMSIWNQHQGPVLAEERALLEEERARANARRA